MPAFTSSNYYGIIRAAMQNAGYLRKGSDPTSQDLADYGTNLADIINLWQTQGLKLFLNKVIEFPLVAGQNLYTMGPTGNVVMDMPKRILQANVVTPEGIRRPLVSLGWQEWMTLSQIDNNESTISSYFVDKQVTSLNVYFWNTPDIIEATNKAQLLTQVGAANPINLEDSMEFPQEWRIALVWALADEISTGQPAAIMERCSSRAATFREVLENWDVEDSPTTFAMDSRNYYGVGRFR